MMSDEKQGQGMLTRIKTVFQPKQSDCCSVSIEAVEEAVSGADRSDRPDRPSADGGS